MYIFLSSLVAELVSAMGAVVLEHRLSSQHPVVRVVVEVFENLGAER